MKRIAAIVLAGCLIVGNWTMSVCAENDNVIAESQNLQMSLGAGNDELYIYNSESKTVYTTSASQQELEAAKGAMRLKLQSLVTGSFYDLQLKKETEFYSASQDIVSKRSTIKKGDGAVCIQYSMKNGLGFLVEVMLENGELKIQIPAESIQETERFVFKQFQIAPNLVSASAAQKGYFLLPDGCGAVMNFNNGKSGVYDEPVYGINKAFVYEAYAVSEENIYLPVFGMERDGACLLAVISQGAAISRVRAATNGNETVRNRAYPVFLLREKDEQYITDDVFQTVIQDISCLSSDLEMTYLFGSEGGYSEMASIFRSYIQNQGIEKAKQSDSCVLLSIYGAVKTKQKLFGVPLYDKAQQITSYETAEEILEQFSAQLQTSPVVRLAAWDADTVMGYSVNSFQPVGKKRELSKLLDICKKQGIDVYLSEPFSVVQKAGKGIRLKRDVIRNLANELSIQYSYYHASNSVNFDAPYYYLLDSSIVLERAKKLTSSLTKYEFTGIAIEDLSKMCYSNFRKGNVSSQESTKVEFQEVLGFLAGQDSLLLESGYYYALPYGNMVYNAPGGSSKQNIMDAEVPFYQMVLSGLKSFTGSPINRMDNRRAALLKALETGAYIHYEIVEDTDSLQGTNLEKLYGAQWKLNSEGIKSELQEFEPVLQQIAGKTILQHEILQSNVTRTWYENGCVVTVNYNDESVTVDGVTINALDYVLERGNNG